MPSRRLQRILPIIQGFVFLCLFLAGAHGYAATRQEAEGLLLSEDSSAFPGGWEHTDTWADAHRILYLFGKQGEATRFHVVLEPLNENGNAFGRTDSFNIYYKLPDDSSKADQEDLRVLMEEIVRRVKRNDKRTIRLVSPPPPAPLTAGNDRAAPSDDARLRWVPAWGRRLIDSVERAQAFLLLLLSGIAVLMLLPVLARRFREKTPAERLFFGAFLAIALILRLLAPHRLVMNCSGYGLIEQAIHFGELRKYGAGTPLFYHLLLQVVPGEGDAYLRINTIVGWLTLPLAALWLDRIVKRPWVGTLFLLLMAVLPLSIKDHNSESNLIPVLFFFFIGLNWLEEYRDSRRLPHLLFSIGTLLFTVYSRPFFLIFVPAAVLFSHLTRTLSNRPRMDGKSLFLAFSGGLLFLLPHLVFLLMAYVEETSHGGAGGFETVFSAPLTDYLSGKNILFRPDYFPPGYLLLWAPAFAVSLVAVRRRLAFLLAMNMLFVILYFADLPEPSVPRLFMPSVVFAVMIAAIGLERLSRKHADSKKGRGKLIFWGLILGLSMPLPVRTLWAPTNDDEEHRMLEEAARRLPERGARLGILWYGDAPYTWGVFRDYPEYLFRPPRRDVELVRLEGMLEGASMRPWMRTEEKTDYVYLGSRCYWLNRHVPKKIDSGRISEALIGKDYIHPLCKKIKDSLILEPIIEKRIPNHAPGDHFTWYPPRKELLFGLYRVRGSRETAPAETNPPKNPTIRK